MRTKVIDSIKLLVELISPSGDKMSAGDLQWHVSTIREDNRQLQGQLHKAQQQRTEALERLKENKEMTEEKQSPVYDSVGVEVRGDVKVVYNAKGLSKTHGRRGESWFTTRTECGRDVVNIRHPSGTYEVAIFLNGELERGYRGKEGSDAHRVYEGTLRFWAMREERATLSPTVAQVEDMRFVELCVPDGEHCLPSEAVPPPPTVRIVGVDFAAEEQAARRAHPEYQQMLLNLTNTQKRCTKQEQEIRDLREKVRNLCHEATDMETAHATELEEMREQYEDERSRADKLQDELVDTRG